MDDREELDVVDDDDRVVFRAPRERVHREYHIHRSVMFFVFDEDGRIFVNQRAATRETYPLVWSVAFGGHVRSGEQYDDAVRREIREEVGLAAAPLLIGPYRKRTPDERENSKVYGLVADAPLALDPRELEQGEFMPLSQAVELRGRQDFLPETDDLLRILFEYTSAHAVPRGR